MSNLNDFINDVGKGNAGAIAIVGDVLGTAADFAGAIGGVVDAISLLASLFSSGDAVAKKLDEIEDLIRRGFAELREQVKGEALLAQWRHLDDVISKIEAVGITVQAWLADPTLPIDRAQELEEVFAGMLVLGKDAEWLAVHDDRLSYQAPWGTRFLPPVDGFGLQFSFTYVLPAYLRAFSALMSVGAALFPDFAIKYSVHVRAFRDFLAKQHDRIVNEGFVDLVPSATVRPTHAGFAFGTVEKFSGYHAEGWFTPPPTGGLTDAEWQAEFRHRFALAALKLHKDVYAQLGLSNARRAIDRVTRLLDGTVAPPPLGDWSLAQIFATLGYPENRLLGTTRSVAALRRYLIGPPPAGQSTSLRSLLGYAAPPGSTPPSTAPRRLPRPIMLR